MPAGERESVRKCLDYIQVVRNEKFEIARAIFADKMPALPVKNYYEIRHRNRKFVKRLRSWLLEKEAGSRFGQFESAS